MDAASKTQAVAATSPKAGRKSSRAVLVGGILLVAVVAGAIWATQDKSRANDGASSENSNVPKYIAHLDGFTVNLADPEETHFLRVTIDLGIDHLPEGADKSKPMQSLPTPRVRDTILSVLTVCKADELLTADGKLHLKKNLMDSLNKTVPELGVREIYFTEFLVQR